MSDHVLFLSQNLNSSSNLPPSDHAESLACLIVFPRSSCGPRHFHALYLTLLDPIPAERDFALGSLRRALAGLPDPARGFPGWPRHPRHRRPSPEVRATPRARTGAAQLSIFRHGVSAAESPVPVRRHVMSLRPTARFGGSNGPSKGQRAVPLPVRLARRLILAWSAGQPSRP